MERLFAMPFAAIYGAYLKKIERKGRQRAELDTVVCWLTGYDAAGLEKQLAGGKVMVDVRTFFDQAPALNPRRALITGTICGVRIEAVADPLMQKIRQLDKLVDELAQGRPMEKVLRRG